MQGDAKERWRILCEQIANEQNPARFTELVIQLLEELRNKEERLKGPTKRTSAS